MVREGFSGGTRAAFLSYSKSFVDSFLCYNSFVCYANVANSFICYINVKYIWANYVLLKPGVYTPTLKKHQVVRDLKKFENHWTISIATIAIVGCITQRFHSADTRLHYYYIGSMNYDHSFVVTVTVTCYSWAPSSGDHFFTCGTISRPPHKIVQREESGQSKDFKEGKWWSSLASVTATYKQSPPNQGERKNQAKRHLKVTSMHMEVRVLFGRIGKRADGINDCLN